MHLIIKAKSEVAAEVEGPSTTNFKVITFIEVILVIEIISKWFTIWKKEIQNIMYKQCNLVASEDPQIIMWMIIYLFIFN